ncbi:MAG: putative porin [Pseudomonadales bacterium]|nr:putative porin [Pseudomonadales bacterium]MBO6565764.1 putative porin [Pseudomonadales bacterium]MBO6596896.1 putative porin [Pseudomonadales bacterium]MBO6823115.1 putative porin [Pseudomonadales bacterium]
MHYVIFLTLLLLGNQASAAVSEEEFAELSAQLGMLMERVATLEAENKTLKEAPVITQIASEPVAAAPRKNEWTDTIAIKGDFRYRYEHIDAERSDTRERNRVRARAEISAKPTDNLKVGIGIASGGDDPVSTNQTLGGGASTKDVRLDLAYFSYQATEGLNITGGKMKNIYRRIGGNGLIWDGDYRPEGLAFIYERGNFFFDTSFNFLESDSKSGNETIAYGIQTGFDIDLGSGNLLAGASYYDIGVAGREVYFGDDNEFFGNSFTCVDPLTLNGCTYTNDYEEVELFVEFKTTLAERPFSLFADVVQNQAADDLDTGWAAGVKLGKASKPRSWEFSYIYQDLEADAVFGLLADSDFGGGGTDARGHILKGAWAVNKKWKIGFTYFDNERNIDLGREEDYSRFMLDTAFKF